MAVRSHRKLRIAATSVSVVFMILGVAGIGDDITTWQRWLASVGNELAGNMGRWLLVISGVGLLLIANEDKLRAYFSGSNAAPSPLSPLKPSEPEPRKQPELPEPPEAVPVAATLKRVFTTATPEQLTGFYRDHLAIHAENLVKPYLGKWKQVSGPLGNVDPHKPGIGSAVNFAYRAGFVPVLMYFTDEVLVDRLSMMDRGREITVIGWIETVTDSIVVLNDCELL